MHTLRKMNLSDIDEVHLIEIEAHQTPWSKKILQDCVFIGYDCRVLLQDNSIVGYIISRVSADTYHILNICIAKKHQGQGLGNYLLTTVFTSLMHSEIKTVFLEVRASNVSAISLYKKLGFNVEGIKRNYYEAGSEREDACVMKIDLTSEA